MDIMNTVLTWLVSVIASILPKFGFSDEFMAAIDGAFSFLIGVFQSASYFLPLTIVVACLTVMGLVDNWSLLYRFGKWVIGIIRG